MEGRAHVNAMACPRPFFQNNVHPMSAAENAEYDVVVCGGSLAGAATALLLLRAQPGLRVAIIEKSTRFARRVGEATVEVSGYFLGRVLGLTQHLNEHHLAKQGMRFWFANDQARSLADCSEVGGRYLTRMPAWQVDRSVLDEEVLLRAAEAGATLLRPAKARSVTLRPGGVQVVLVETEDGTREVTGRWVVDASGFTALLARQEGWLRRNHAHPTTALWARWRGLKDLDGRELAERHPEWFHACPTIRATATNHLMGDGWWAWIIPLKGGDTSVGVVFDQRRVTWPRGIPLAGGLKDFLMRHHPVARELMADATAVDGDVSWRAHLPYCSNVFAGDGFVLVGDAAGFIDPFYSPGMDWLSYTATMASRLVLAALGTPPAAATTAARDAAATATAAELPGRIQRHNATLARSYARWFDAIYRDKYDVMGDHELMRAAFELDLALYYVGVVSQPVQLGADALEIPVFAARGSEIPYRLMRLYNRRLAAMARARRARGTFGRANAGRRVLLKGFLPERASSAGVLRAVLRWLALEATEGWRSWFNAFPTEARRDARAGFGPMAPAHSPPAPSGCVPPS